jgi:hypothetical protein
MSLQRVSDAADLPDVIDVALWAARSPGGALCIGRDKHHVRLDAAAAPRLLSRSHCSMRLEGRDLLLTDLGSTNGTFFTRPGDEENTQRAPPRASVRLPPGTTIYFGGEMTIDADHGSGSQSRRLVPNPAAYIYIGPPPAATPSPSPSTTRRRSALGGSSCDGGALGEPRRALPAAGGGGGGGGGVAQRLQARQAVSGVGPAACARRCSCMQGA